MPDPRLLVLLPALLLVACGGDPGTGPVEVKWDRITCERCRMVLSDRKHAAQVRLRESDGRSSVHPFDDIGCALIWLQGDPSRDTPSTEIWVNDWRNGDWIDARTAFYVPNQVTPMEYGLGAQRDRADGALSFEEARARVLEVEQGGGRHSGHAGHAGH